MSCFGYAGEWVDETTGYSFLRARWLDVKTGSFLSEDPLVQMTQSAFDYTGGDPLTQIDPLGLYWGENLVNKAKNAGKKVAEKIVETIKDENTIEFLGKMSTGLGGVAAGLAVASVVFPVIAPITAPMSTAIGVASLATGGIATIGNCMNETLDKCGWGIASTVVSAIPLSRVTNSGIEYMGKYAKRRIPKHLSTIETGRVNQLKMNSKIGYSSIQWSGFAVDRYGNAITSKDGVVC